MPESYQWRWRLRCCRGRNTLVVDRMLSPLEISEASCKEHGNWSQD